MIHRRSLFGAAGAALALSAVKPSSLVFAPGPLAAAPSPGRRSLKKCLKLGMIQVEGSLTDKFAAAKAAGFDGVEVDRAAEHAEVLEAKQSSGLEVPGVIDWVHWKDTLGDADPEVRARGVAGLETALRDAHVYGASVVLLVPAVVNAQVSYAQAWEHSRAEIAKVLPLAAELEIKIGIENVWNNFLLSPLEAARYVDSFDSPWIGWYMDIGNIVNYGWPEQWIRILGERIVRLDIKEFSKKKRDDEGLWKGFGVKLGEGSVDWAEVMRAVDEIGFEGWGSAEVGGGGPERLAEIAERMERLFAS